MSSRQLRKLQQQRELEAQAKLHKQEEEDEESEDEAIAPAKAKPSLFANLADLDDDEEEDEPQQEEQEGEKSEVEAQLSDLVPTTAPKKPKKSKKKKKGKGKAKDKPVEKKNGEDDIDAALKELALEHPKGHETHAWMPSVDPEYERVCKLLGVQTQHLKVANEMRNLFGKEVLGNHEDAGGRVRGNRRQQRARQQVDLETALKGNHAPGKGLSEITLRRNNFIQGKEDWPKGTTGGLTMEMVDDRSDDGTVEFKFVHNKMYQDLQKTFRGYVEIGDPQNLIKLLQMNPYHISLLLQVSKIAKDQSDHALASDLIERALFSFGRACLSHFNTKLAQGKARLDFSRPENRELWLAGYHYIKALIMKGTYRTAFEWAKLLLSLDPEEDPYSMRLMIHHLALRAHEFNWLLNVGESIIPEIWAPQGLDLTFAAVHTTPSLAFAALQLREGAETRKLLTQSMKAIPWLFTRLFKELSLDAPPSIWGLQSRSDAETLFTELYISQTKDLWNTPEATALLMEVAHTVKDIDISALPLLGDEDMSLNVVRFIYLDNNPTIMALAPSSLLHRENNSDSDPLPPDHNIFSYAAQQHWIHPPDRVESGGLAGDFLDPLAALARIIPGFRAFMAAPDDPANGERIRQGIAAYARREGREVPDVPAGERSVAQRLLDMLGFGGDGMNEIDDDEEDEEDEDEFLDAEEDMNESSEDEIPDLIPMQ